MAKNTSIGKNKGHNSDFYVVGIGASAGGLEAIQSLFDSMPNNTGMAFVIVQHLSPNYKSMMDELLKKHTKMPIRLAENNIELQPNTIYLNPKEKNIIYKQGKILHQDKLPHLPLNLPIDLFFHSLGNGLEEKCIGIILSGTGTDGSRGIGTIKGAGGTVIVQDPESAQFDGMPVTAINSGNAEFIVVPEKMGMIISRITTSYLYERNSEEGKNQEDIFFSILDLLYKSSGIDFTLYKNSTLLRRIEKRLAINQLSNIYEYAAFLKGNKNEQELLTRDCLIGVTSFFRDMEAFEAIKEKVLPDLFSNKKKNQPVRFWITACSTGEEAYSMAILIEEYLKENKISADYKMFASDVDTNSVQMAAQGIYPVNHIADIPREYLEKHFLKTGEFFEISKRIREKIVFSRHNILKDPPFIKMDFISCRNMLIYMLPKVQYKIIGTLQFSLNKGGYLFLGHSENLGDSEKLFKTINANWRIHQSIADYKELPSRLQSDFRLKTYDSKQAGFKHPDILTKDHPDKVFAEKLAGEFGPVCVFIDKNFNVLYINGDINDYVAFKPGTLHYNLLEMLVDDKLSAMVRNGIRRVSEEKKKIVFKDISFNNGKKQIAIDLTFQGFEMNGLNEGIVLISFEKNHNGQKKESTIIYDQYNLDEFSKQRIEDLESELKKIKQELQSTIEELETSNEELQASNEELQASNEELQSTNEELQSVNEELYTVNAEVQVKNRELIELNDDINNLLDSTAIATLFLDADLRIRKFTPALKIHFDLNENDIGRPISNFASNFREQIRLDFISDSKLVLRSKKMIEKEIYDDAGKFYIRRITPFLTEKNVAKGVVITMIDITESKKKSNELLLSEKKFRTLVESSPNSIILVEASGKIKLANKQTEKLFGYSQKELIGQKIEILIPPIFHKEHLKHRGQFIKNPESREMGYGRDLHGRHKNGKDIILEIGLTPFLDGGDKMIMCTIIDITNRKKIETELKKANSELLGYTEQLKHKTAQLIQSEKMNAMGTLIAGVAHELNNPLMGILNYAAYCKKHIQPENKAYRVLDDLIEEAQKSADIVSNLLTFSRKEEYDAEQKSYHTDLLKVINDSMKIIRFKNRNEKIKISIPKNKLNATSNINPGYFQQLVLNLVDNAMDAVETAEKREIIIELKENKEFNIMNISDSGPGINPEDQQKIFDPFYTTKPVGKGTGLGLSICKNILDEIGGAIYLNPEKKEETTFLLKIPKSRD